jgi:hypothetical protein
MPKINLLLFLKKINLIIIIALLKEAAKNSL